ncbi:MAG TPA: AraC family transcriptional regulator [Chthonomonadaceae bacterium]|nr:AraC family transcriptional regulator [Chthonomonadaceae bacterium]
MSNAFPIIEVVRSYMTPGLHLEETLYPGGLRYPRHVHEPAYLTCFLAGGLTEYYTNASSPFDASSLIYHPPGEVHAFHIEESGLRALTVEMKPEWPQQFRRKQDIGAQRVCVAGGPFTALKARLLRELQEPDRYSSLAIESLVLETLVALFRCTTPDEKQQPRWLRQVAERLREQFPENPRLEVLAAEAGVHPVHLARTFRRYYRCTVGEYIRQLRLDTACRALACTDATLVEIALQAGFTDQSQFCRQLRAHTGFTPSAYRKAHRAG